MEPRARNDESLLRDVFESARARWSDRAVWNDCIHIVLGRGLLQQAAAFVLGFTTGGSRPCPAWHTAFFRFSACPLYQGVDRFSELHAQVFEFALLAARRLNARDLHRMNFRGWVDGPVGELRAALEIAPAVLCALYAAERALWPRTRASQRLHKVR